MADSCNNCGKALPKLAFGKCEFCSNGKCPSCGEKAISDYMMAQTFGNNMFELAKDYLNPLLIPSVALNLVKGLTTPIFKGYTQEDTEQLICTNCKAFFARCPHCYELVRMSGRISRRYQATNCSHCKRSFDVK